MAPSYGPFFSLLIFLLVIRNAMKLLKLFLCRKSIDGACAAVVIISEGIWRSLFLATNKRWCKFKSASSCNSKHVTPAQSPEGAFFSQLLLIPELRRFFYYILSYFHHCLKWNKAMNWLNQTTLVLLWISPTETDRRRRNAKVSARLAFQVRRLTPAISPNKS